MNLAQRIGQEVKAIYTALTTKVDKVAGKQLSTEDYTTAEKALVSTAEQPTNKNIPDGYAGLDGTGKIGAAQLPSYVDDVLEVATYADLPLTGATGVIYIVVADETSGGNTSSYRWSGTVYAMVSNTLTATDIEGLYEGLVNTNKFEDAEKTKLSTLENTDNHTDGLTNGVYTLAERAKLLAIEPGATGDLTGAEIKALYEAELNAFTDTLFTKLAGIEDSATADQTGAEIKALYEAELDTNAFTDLLLAKLNGIEANATGDLTGSEIKSLYQTELKAFTDTLFDKLDAIEAGATADQTGAEIKAALFAELDTNNLTDTLLTKLNGIEDNATADQTGAEIKLAYESELDTNAFTDALLSKLNAIEAGATGDLTGTEIKTLLFALADTNNLTDTLLTKLNGIESGATADQSWGQIGGTLSSQTDLQNALNAKQNTLTFDTVPTNGSTNPVQSNGVFDSLATKANLTTNTFTGNQVIQHSNWPAIDINAVDGLTDANIFLRNVANNTYWRIHTDVSSSDMLGFGRSVSGGAFNWSMNLFTNGNARFFGYTGLGLNAPAIQQKKLTGTSPSTAGAEVTFAHGLTPGKILGYTILLDYSSTGNGIPPSYTGSAGYEYNSFLGTTSITCRLTSTNSSNILSKPVRILITYEA